MGNSIWIPHTPCRRFNKHHQGECEFQADKLIWHLNINQLLPCDKPNLRITWKVCAFENSHFPCGTLIQNFPQGVYNANGIAHFELPNEIPTPSVVKKILKFSFDCKKMLEFSHRAFTDASKSTRTNSGSCKKVYKNRFSDSRKIWDHEMLQAWGVWIPKQSFHWADTLKYHTPCKCSTKSITFKLNNLKWKIKKDKYHHHYIAIENRQNILICW